MYISTWRSSMRSAGPRDLYPPLWNRTCLDPPKPCLFVPLRKFLGSVGLRTLHFSYPYQLKGTTFGLGVSWNHLLRAWKFVTSGGLYISMFFFNDSFSRYLESEILCHFMSHIGQNMPGSVQDGSGTQERSKTVLNTHSSVLKHHKQLRTPHDYWIWSTDP